MNELLKNAIADANLLRETALENARAAILEAFKPRIQKLFSEKVKEELEGEDDEEVDQTTDITDTADATDTEEDSKLEILPDDEVSIDDDIDEDLDIHVDTDEDLSDEDIDITFDDINEDEPTDDEDLDDDDIDEDLDIHVDTDEDLSDEDINITFDDETNDDDEDIDIEDDTKTDDDELTESNDMDDDDIDEDLDIHIDSDEELNDDDVEIDFDNEDDEILDDEEPTASLELQEAYKVIKNLRKQINESNLANTKVNLMNKLFNKYNLSEQGKKNVLKQFDKAKTLNEANITFKAIEKKLQPTKTAKHTSKRTLHESVKSTTKPIIKENQELFPEYLAERFRKLSRITK